MTGMDDVIGRIRFTDTGLVPAVIQQWDSREVLMMGWMDARGRCAARSPRGG